MKFWFLLAITKLSDNFKPVLIKLAAITPIIVYDTKFSECIRSYAKSEELGQFTTHVFEKFEEEILSKNGVKLNKDALK